MRAERERKRQLTSVEEILPKQIVTGQQRQS